jgi:hypothetical protein
MLTPRSQQEAPYLIKTPWKCQSSSSCSSQMISQHRCPVPLPPFSEAYHQVKASIKDLSEDLWAMLGDAIPPQQQEAIDLTVETHSHSNLAMVSNDVENIIAKTVQAIQQGPARPKELTVKEQELRTLPLMLLCAIISSLPV